jgi:PKD repeat protein
MVLVFLALGLALPVAAQKVKGGLDSLDNLAFARPDLRLAPQYDSLESLRAGLPPESLAGLDAFLGQEGKGWTVVADRLTGKPALLEGAGIPWIPGTANSLSGKDLGLPEGLRGADVPMEVLGAKALAFLAANPTLFGVDVSDLTLVPGASGPVGDYLYYLEFGVQRAGIPVESARVVFRMNHGNLVQMGQECIAPVLAAVDVEPAITTETAWQVLNGYLGEAMDPAWALKKDSLVILPAMTRKAADGNQVAPGTGLEYRLAWVLAFRKPGVLGTWEARVDARTGELLAFRDINEYGSVHGGTYVGDRPVPEADRPFPFADLGGGLYADGAGRFTATSATSALDGQYVQISDNCGAISNSTSTGDLDFGSGPGVDCITPGFGGAGNTHAARTQFYNINLIKMKALTYLPSNTWLTGKLTDVVNIDQVCNAYWDPLMGTLNFFRSGSGCDNTGELPGVSLHEFGHGLDNHDGNGSSPDNGTGETYGDFTAALQTHNSCGGAGFFMGSVNCSGYGDACTSCSGVRDIDFAKHQSGAPAVPTMLNGSTGFRCDLNASYAGPCGYEGHCESYISSEAMWDLATRDLVTWGLDLTTAWQLVDRLWYLSRSTATAAYACPSLATSNGCGTGNLFTVLRVADDADGNLANGTPHASAIYAAFNRHAIACSSVNNTDQTGGCPSLGAPVLSATPGMEQVTLSWPSVSGASQYLVYRNESGCDAGFTKVGTTASLGFTDSAPANNVTYYYRVQAAGTSQACVGPMSNCKTVMPLPCRGLITLDRTIVNCAATLGIHLDDVDLLGAGSQNVEVFSTAETAPETVSLTETPASSGRFSGTVATTTSTAHGDGAIGVADGVMVTVRYGDANACGAGAATIDETILVDCVGPVISGVTVTSTDVQATITWTTSEPATSRVTWGATSPPSTVVDVFGPLTTSHSVMIDGLTACTTYFLTATSADLAGNTATDDGGGTYRPFVSKGLSYLLMDGVENGTGVWTVQTTQGSAWHIDTCRSHSSSHAWKAGAAQGTCPGLYAPNTLAYLVSPTVNLGVAGHGYHLRFWEWGKTEVNGYGQIMDFCHVQISTDGGTLYTDIVPAYGGDSSGWQFTDIDLASYSGNVKVRFFFASDWGWEYEGWYLDDIEVSRTITCAPDLKFASSSVQDFCSGGGTGSANGVVDPGEDIVLSATLSNQGPAGATGVTGTLTTTTPGVSITWSSGAFDNVPSLGTGSSQAPHFAFRVTDGAMACGTAISLSLHLTSNENPAGWDQPFTVITGAQSLGSVTTLLSENFNSFGNSWPTGWTRTPASGSTGTYWRIPSYQVYNCDGNTSNFNMSVDTSSSNNANAWSFTPALSCAAGVTYTLTFDQRTGGCGSISDAGGTLEALIGTSASTGMSTSLLLLTGLLNTACINRSATFTVPSSGTYYIGFKYTRNVAFSYCGVNVDNVLVTYSPIVCTQTACTPSSALRANTAAVPTYAVRPYSVSFTGLATGGTSPYSYSWAFGDGGNSALQSPGHVYTTAGSYTAALTVTDNDSGTNTDSHLSIQIVDPLSAMASGTPLTGSAPLVVDFTGARSGGDGSYTYEWDFGDGTAHGTTQNPSHTYSACGTYTVTFQVNDGHGAGATDSHLVVVAGGALAATSNLTNCSSGAAPLNATFTGVGSCGAPPYTYSWNFGDGTALSVQQNPLHTYTSAGNYSAVLTVKDSLNDTVSAAAIPVTVTSGGGAVTENFDGATAPNLPTGWGFTVVTGSGAYHNWRTRTTTYHPSGQAPPSSPNLVFMECYNITSGGQVRLYKTSPVPLGSTNGRTAQVSFAMYHDTGFTTYADNVQVQYSLDGTTNWTSVGSAVNRYDGTNGWKQHTVDLSSLSCVASAYIGFLGTSKYGNDLNLDDISIVNAPKPATVVLDSASVSADTCGSGGAGNSDGRIDPGEAVQVTVTLKNTGSVAATGISGLLSTATTGVTVTGGSSTFPDLPTYFSTGASTAPFTLSVADTVACGTVIACTLNVTTAQGSFPLTFNLTVGGTSTSGLLSQNFDGSYTPPYLPPGWSQSVVLAGSPSPDWVSTASPANPSATCHSGSKAVTFNSGTAANNSQARLVYGTPMNLSSFGSSDAVTWTFWIYRYPNAGTDRIQPQVSTDGGTNWSNLGSAIPLTDTSSGWKMAVLDMAAYKGQAAVLVGILGISNKAYNIHLDDIDVVVTQPLCNICLPGVPPSEVAPGTTPQTAQTWLTKDVMEWPVVGSANLYSVYRGTQDDLRYLLTGAVNSCIRYRANAPNASIDDDPTGVSGGFFWYLVTGSNAHGEGGSGSATGGPRIINAPDYCP